MPLPSSGPLSLGQIQGEFGGTNPISITEYYRGGTRVVGGAQNSGIPKATPGRISFSNFRAASRTVIVTYEIIGGGGAGGYGLEDGFGSGRGGSGGDSEIVGGGVNITAPGGIGGRNGAGDGDGGDPPGFRDGEATVYGPGGVGAPNGQSGNPAPATSYGAGGGGAGGDGDNLYDTTGATGEGGFAGTRRTGTFTIAYGASVTVTIGQPGQPSAGGVYNGGTGAGGFCRLSFDGKTRNFTATEQYTVI